MIVIIFRSDLEFLIQIRTEASGATLAIRDEATLETEDLKLSGYGSAIKFLQLRVVAAGLRLESLFH